MSTTQPQPHQVEVKYIDPIFLVTADHKGDYAKIQEAFGQLYGLVQEKQLSIDPSRAFGLYYADPTQVAVEDLQSKAGFAVAEKDFAHLPAANKTKVERAKYAIYTHKGSYAAFPDLYKWLYHTWPTTSGATPDPTTPSLEIYLNDMSQTPEEDLLTLIHMPLK